MKPRSSSGHPTRFTFVGDLLRALGGVSPERVRMRPAPGTANLRDLIHLQKKEGLVLELVDGTLVAKTVGFIKSYVAARLAASIGSLVEAKQLGVVAGASGVMKLMPRLARGPDVSFVSWDQLPGHHVPRDPVPGLHPDLAVEVLSKGNTRGEMTRKRKEYFLAGTRLVWQVNPRKRTVDVYAAPDQFTTLTAADTLDGGDVLPGFTLPVKALFVHLPPAAPKRGKRRR
jgi:Uma2 family endonuclease